MSTTIQSRGKFRSTSTANGLPVDIHVPKHVSPPASLFFTTVMCSSPASAHRPGGSRLGPVRRQDLFQELLAVGCEEFDQDRRLLGVYEQFVLDTGRYVVPIPLIDLPRLVTDLELPASLKTDAV